MKPALILVVALVAAGASGTHAEEPPVEDVGSIMVAFGAHLDGHPLAGGRDLYKLLHQAVYGPGHAIPSRETAARWLEREIEGLGPTENDETECDALGGEPPLVRVNLRPFFARGGDPDQLIDAFVAAADRVGGSARRMEVVLALAASYLECAGRGELAPELRALGSEMSAAGFPAVHHSEAYVEAYRPAYRVVEEAVARANGWCGDRADP